MSQGLFVWRASRVRRVTGVVGLATVLLSGCGGGGDDSEVAAVPAPDNNVAEPRAALPASGWRDPEILSAASYSGGAGSTLSGPAFARTSSGMQAMYWADTNSMATGELLGGDLVTTKSSGMLTRAQVGVPFAAAPAPTLLDDPRTTLFKGLNITAGADTLVATWFSATGGVENLVRYSVSSYDPAVGWTAPSEVSAELSGFKLVERVTVADGATYLVFNHPDLQQLQVVRYTASNGAESPVVAPWPMRYDSFDGLSNAAVVPIDNGRIAIFWRELAPAEVGPPPGGPSLPPGIGLPPGVTYYATYGATDGWSTRRRVTTSIPYTATIRATLTLAPMYSASTGELHLLSGGVSYALGDAAIFHQVLRDGVWSEPVAIDAPTIPDSETRGYLFPDGLQLASNSRGDMLACWTQVTRVRFGEQSTLRCTDYVNGRGWSAAADVAGPVYFRMGVPGTPDEPYGGIVGHMVALTDNGRAAVLWKVSDADNLPVVDTLYVREFVADEGWRPQQAIATAPERGQLTPRVLDLTDRGDITVAWVDHVQAFPDEPSSAVETLWVRDRLGTP